MMSRAVAMLARGDLLYSTGQAILVDGGLTVQRLQRRPAAGSRRGIKVLDNFYVATWYPNGHPEEWAQRAAP